MSALTLKRLAVVVISQILGFFIGFLIIRFGFDLLPIFTAVQVPQGRGIAEFGYEYYIVTCVPLGIIVMIWADAFLDTRILPD